MIFCGKCKVELTDENWLECRRKKNRKICKFCVRSELKKSQLKYKHRNCIANKQFRLDVKIKVFNHYGGKCNECNTSDYSTLSLDHINGNGRKHRKEVLGTDSGSVFYKWVLKNKPVNIRLLCYNCNCQHKMILSKLIVNNKDYLKNKLCKFCGSDYKIKSKICAKCLYKCKANRQIKAKSLVYQVYGGKCVNCFCNKFECLTVDHIDNSGAKHRNKIGINIYSWLKSNNYPKENYQLLCFNCNYNKYFDNLNS